MKDNKNYDYTDEFSDIIRPSCPEYSFLPPSG